MLQICDTRRAAGQAGQVTIPDAAWSLAPPHRQTLTDVLYADLHIWPSLLPPFVLHSMNGKLGKWEHITNRIS